jgi:hypothetical protein
MDPTEALIQMLDSTSWDDFQQRRDRLHALVAQQELMARRDALMQQRQQLDPWNTQPPPPPPKPSVSTDVFLDPAHRAQKELMARRDALMRQRDQLALTQAPQTPSAPAFSARQESFLRNFEFLLYLKMLDRLITKFDRENNFEFSAAAEKTINEIKATQVFAAAARAAAGKAISVVPDLPRKMFAGLARKMFIRYINWKPALDLNR